MTGSDPLLTSSGAILWLKVLLTVGLLALLYVRYRRRGASGAAGATYATGTKLLVAVAVVLSFAVFHSFGSPRSGKFVHHGEMFHYYLGSKYFQELGHYRLYDAVIAADAEQDGALARLPFYTDLTTYQNASHATALEHAGDVKQHFSKARWRAFKRDVGVFKKETGMPSPPGIFFFLMDHGYNASPVSTLLLGTLTNLVPVTQLKLLASLDLLLVAAMISLVFRTFGLLTGGLFSVYFFVNILNDQSYISGGLLRYDWLLCIVAGVCLLEMRRPAAAAVCLTVAAMLKVFPAVLLFGVLVSIVQRARTKRAVDAESRRFMLAAGVAGLALFLLPALSLGSVLRPWQEFGEKTALHDRGVYVNHLGLRGVLLFEPSHLSLEEFADTYKTGASDDVVRNWQDVKEREFAQKRPLVGVATLLVLACLTVIIWKRRPPWGECVLWPLPLIYVASYPSHYYYAFLCLFVLLFCKRLSARGGFIPVGLLLLFNVASLATDAFGPSPIVFYTLVNAYLFACLAAMLGFSLYDTLAPEPAEPVTPEPIVGSGGARAPVKPGRGKNKSRALRLTA